MRQTSFQDQLDAVRSLCRDRNVQAGYVDQVGIGYGLAERI